MKYQHKAIVIVGAYSTGAFYAPNFIARGYQCVHIHPGADIGEFFLASHRPQDFVKDITWDGDDEAVIQALAPFTVLHILAGSEAGVLLADRLNEHYALPSRNDFALTQARRNKYSMQEALRAAGLAAIDHIKSSDLSEVFRWMGDKPRAYPIVVKPVDSAGTDNVFICEDAAAVETAFLKVRGTKNIFSKPNEEVLVQEYVKGCEYVVNTVSHAGRHHVTDIIKVHKQIIDGSPVYDFAQLLSPDEHPDVFRKLTAYIKLALTALGIKHGPGHSELIMAEGGQPVLIETAARPIGGIDPSAYTEALGYNQISATVEAYINPEAFFNLVNPMMLRKRLMCLFLISPIAGSIRHKADVSSIEQLASFHSVVVQDAGWLDKTSSLVNCPGFVNLVSDDVDTLLNDYKRIRSMESGFFDAMVAA